MVERDVANVEVAGSTPVFRSNICPRSSEAERILGKDEVSGSIPLGGSRKEVYMLITI